MYEYTNIRINTNKGETLLEVIMALAVLMLILAPAAGLFMQSNRNTAMNRNELIGLSLASEGLEMMKNFRDTNLIRFSARASDCWNTKPEHATLAGCELDINKIGDPANPDPNAYSSFRLEINPADPGKWTLGNTGGSLSDTLNGAHDNDYQLRLKPGEEGDPSTGLYNYTEGDATPFYRAIEVQYPDANTMITRARVLYRIGNTVREIKREIILTNTPP